MELKICHMYPDVLNLYGDTGNIICMKKRLQWRGIDAVVETKPIGSKLDLTGFDIVFIGGGQDFEQEVLLDDLHRGKTDEIRSAVEDGIVLLAVCGGYQMLGSYYETYDGKRCDFTGLLDLYTVGGLSINDGDKTVTVDGEVVLNVCLLPFSENSDILKEVRNIPFRYEMDLDGATEDSFLSAKAEVSKTSLKIFVDEEKDNSVVSAEIGVAVFADAYSLSEIDCVSDAYSPSVVLELKREPIERLTGVFTRFEDVRFRGQGLCKVPDYSRLNKTIGETIAGYSVRTEGNDLIVDGEIRADALFSDSDNVLSAKELIVPISFSLEGAAGSEIAQLLLRSLNVRLKGGEIECEVSIKASVIRREITTFSVVTGIEEGAEKAVNDSAISVYIGKALDTEWDVIKALGESAEKIAALNPDVVYPLSGGERIVVFRNKK